MFVSQDRTEALVNLVMTHVRANGPFPFVKLQGLLPERIYHLQEQSQQFTGASLMYGGYSFQLSPGDYCSVQLHFT